MAPAKSKPVTQTPDVYLQAMATAITLALQPTMDAFVEDKNSRHSVRNTAETAISLATTATANMVNLEKRIDALVGDGSGDNGQIASMQKTIRQTERDMQEVKGDMKTILATMSKLETNTDKSKDFMAGWRGVWVALAVGSTCISIIGGVIALIIKLYR